MSSNARGNHFILALMIVVALAASEILTFILERYVHALDFMTKTVQIINIPPFNLDLNIAKFTLGFDFRFKCDCSFDAYCGDSPIQEGFDLNNTDGACGIILASASPRRKELLEMMGLSFMIEPSDADETVIDDIPACFQVRDLALKKAHSVAQAHPGNIVIGADTLVCLEGRMLGKPANVDDARNMLKLLSGKTHQVMTGIAVVNMSKDISIAEYEVTDVGFRDISEAEIEDYLSTLEPFDKAGAYAIQGKASVFVKSVSGCYYNVVGLPVHRLAGILDSIAFKVTNTWRQEIAQR